MRPILFGALTALIASVALADPQTANVAPVTTLHAEARVVQIDVVATDSHGKPVTDLSKQDFTITDRGKPRVIDIFSLNRGESTPQAPSPSSPGVFSNRNAGPPNLPGHSTVIVLDQLNISHDPDRTAFQTAADEQLQAIGLMSKIPPDERIALYVMAKQLGTLLLQDYTTDRALLMRRLKDYAPRGMKSKPYSYQGKSVAAPGSPRRDPNAGSARDAEAEVEDASRDTMLTLQTLAEHLALVPGRKSVFLVRGRSGLVLMHGSWGPAWDKTFEALNEANVAVNTVGEIAARTGGQTWGMRNDLDAAMAEEIEASRTTYTLGFYLSDTERDNEFHALTVQANRPGLQLFYRQGYYAGDSELPASYEKTAKGDLESSLLNPVNSKGVGITARVDVTRGTPSGKVDVHLNLDPATLSLKERGSGWTGKVEETVVEQNESGNTLSKISDVKEFEVTRANRTNYDTQGIAWPLSVPLMPGATKITIVVRYYACGHVGSLTVPLSDLRNIQ